MKNCLYLECPSNRSSVEYQFFECLLKTWGLADHLEIVGVGGNGNLPKNFMRMQKIQDGGGKNLIVFDGDEYDGKKGCKAIRKEILVKIKEWNDADEDRSLAPELFLMPDDQTEGCVETLIEYAARRKEFLNCFECYVKCLQGNGGFLPDQKAKIFAYMETCIKKFPKNEVGCAFQDEKLWNLNVEELRPLKDFLSKNSELPQDGTDWEE